MNPLSSPFNGASLPSYQVQSDLYIQTDASGIRVIAKMLRENDCESAGNWISDHKIPLHRLELTNDQMIQIAPYLTYLSIDGGWDKSFSNEEFLERLFRRASNVSRLKIKSCTMTGEALQHLGCAEKLRSLEISNCRNFNRRLPDLANLEKIVISLCFSFNQSISGFHALQSCDLFYCRTFDQEFIDLPALHRLNLIQCIAFNRDLSCLPKLAEISISDCKFFTGNMIDLPSLKIFSVDRSPEYNGKLEALPNLEQISIEYSRVFDQSLSRFPLMKMINISNCRAFKSEISGLEALESLRIVNCDGFNRELCGFPNLQKFSFHSPSYNLFDHSAETIRTFLRFYSIKNIHTFFGPLSNERKIVLQEKEIDLFREMVEKAKILDSHGYCAIDYWLIPPAAKCDLYFGFLKISQILFSVPDSLTSFVDRYFSSGAGERGLLQKVWNRICERYPKFARGLEDLPQLRSFSEKVIDLQDELYLFNLIEWIYKMNQALPMSQECLLTLSDLFRRYPEHEIKIKLALQTHNQLDEIVSAITQGELNAPFPTKQAFLQLSLARQSALLLRAVVFREREALSAANHIVKDAVETGINDSTLLQYSLRLYRATGIEGSSKTIERLCAILSSSFPNEIKGQACLTLSEIDYDPENLERKNLLLQCVNTSDPRLQNDAVCALKNYIFTQDDAVMAEKLIALSQQTEDEEVQINLAFVLSSIPRMESLKEALNTVNSPLWDRFDGIGENLGRTGSYVMYPYRLTYHDSRNNMKRIIAERIVEMNRTLLADRAQLRLQEWKEHPDQYPALNCLDANINKIQHSVRYVPFPLFLPPNRFVFRGINERKGDVLGKSSKMDFIRRGGAGTSALFDYDRDDQGTWAKIGHIFTSTRLDSLMPHYFDDKGLLMVIPSDAVNEFQLRRQIRFENEEGINPIFYSTIRVCDIDGIFMHRNIGAELAELSKSSTLEKIASRQFMRRMSGKSSMQEKISYFDGSQPLQTQVKEFIQKHAFLEATNEEIIQENASRQILREILAEELTDAELKACMEFAAKVTPVKIKTGLV